MARESIDALLKRIGNVKTHADLRKGRRLIREYSVRTARGEMPSDLDVAIKTLGKVGRTLSRLQRNLGRKKT